MSREELTRAIEAIESCPVIGGGLCQNIQNGVCGRCDIGEPISLALTALRSELDRVDPQPLSLEQLMERANKPYWHKSLTGRESKWGILPDHIAARPEDYHYGERWLAYDNQPKEEHDD